MFNMPVSAGGGTTPCRWGFSSTTNVSDDAVEMPASTGAVVGNTVDDTTLRGFEIASLVTNTGVVQFSNVTLPEGTQWIHAEEVLDPSLTPDLASSFYLFNVDSQKPVINSVALAADVNDESNDTTTVRLSGEQWFERTG